MPIRQIEVNWIPVSGISTASVLHFWDGVAVGTQRSRLATFLDTIKTVLSDTVSYEIATQGKVLDEATGQMTGIWTDGTSFSGVGSIAEEPVADSTQVLIRWNTNTVRNGRFVLGRTFIPGLPVTNLFAGNLAAAAAGTFNGAAVTFANASSGFGVYSRPRPGVPGAIVTINAAGVSSELAVLRRRRNRV